MSKPVKSSKLKVAGAIGSLLTTAALALGSPAHASDTVCTENMTTDDIAALLKSAAAPSETAPFFNCLRIAYKANEMNGDKIELGSPEDKALRVYCICKIRGQGANTPEQ